MKPRTLGRNGPQVMPLGYGAMSFTDFYGTTTEAESITVLDAALEQGINLIDTANVYGMGRSETVIGRFLAARGPAMREKMVICTKAGISSDPETGARRPDNTRQHLTEQLEGSLKRLNTDCVDLFYVHRRSPEIEIEEVTETLADLVKAGKTRAIGFSEIAPSSLRRAAAIHPIAAVQSEYSLTTRSPDLGLVAACAEVGAALVAFSPVGRGLLTDTPPDAAKKREVAFFDTNPRFQDANLSANLAATEPLRALASDLGVPTAALAIAWVLSRGDHVLTIPGTRSVKHLGELMQGTELVGNLDIIAQIERALPAGMLWGDRYAETHWWGVERYS